MKNYAVVFIVIIFAVLVVSGCETVKSAGVGMAYTAQGVGDDLTKTFKPIPDAEPGFARETSKGLEAGVIRLAQGVKDDTACIWDPVIKLDGLIQKYLW